MEKDVFKVTVVGISPYMQDRMIPENLLPDVEDPKKRGARKLLVERKDLSHGTRELAMKSAYYDIDSNGDRHFYIPSEHFKLCFVGGGGFVKGAMGNAKRTYKNVVASQWKIVPAKIPIPEFDDVDVRTPVNPNSHGRVLKSRPKWTKWTATFILEVWNTTMPLNQIKQIIEYGGLYMGIGSYRPQHTGDFGMFEMSSITKIMENVRISEPVTFELSR